MTTSRAMVLRFIRRAFELAPKREIDRVPPRTRGFYVLFRKIRGGAPSSYRQDVVYIGAAPARPGMRARLLAHRRRSVPRWTHFTIFEVHDEIAEEDMAELDALLRHIYRFDGAARHLKITGRFAGLAHVRSASGFEGWMEGAKSDLPARGQLPNRGSG